MKIHFRGLPELGFVKIFVPQVQTKENWKVQIYSTTIRSIQNRRKKKAYMR